MYGVYPRYPKAPAPIAGYLSPPFFFFSFGVWCWGPGRHRRKRDPLERLDPIKTGEIDSCILPVGSPFLLFRSAPELSLSDVVSPAREGSNGGDNALLRCTRDHVFKTCVSRVVKEE